MTDKKLFHEIFIYNKWAIQQQVSDLYSLEILCKQPAKISFGSVHGLLQHMHYHDLKAYQQLTDPANTQKPDKEYVWEILLPALLAQADTWLSWLEDNVATIDPAKATALTLLSAHNTYHRGQVTAALSLLGAKTSSLDPYLFHSRESDTQ